MSFLYCIYFTFNQDLIIKKTSEIEKALRKTTSGRDGDWSVGGTLWVWSWGDAAGKCDSLGFQIPSLRHCGKNCVIPDRKLCQSVPLEMKTKTKFYKTFWGEESKEC